MYTKIHDLYTNSRTESHLVYKLVYNTQKSSIKKVRSAGFEPAIPSLGSSYLNQAGLTSLPIMNITHDLKFEIIRFRFRHIDNNKKL